MQVFVRDHFPMIAAPVQCHVDGISKTLVDARKSAGLPVDHEAAVANTDDQHELPRKDRRRSSTPPNDRTHNAVPTTTTATANRPVDIG